MNTQHPINDTPADVVRLHDSDAASITRLLSRFGLALSTVAAHGDIPGSFWGDEEAGLVGRKLLARPDTPVHSILHEACHFICMDEQRRDTLHTDAGGDFDEESAVCYLQVLLADFLVGYGRERMLLDMDLWGYSFRLGSAKAWFERDAQDAQAWLLRHRLVDDQRQPRWRLRQ